jgi:predicted Zn-dependent protease
MKKLFISLLTLFTLTGCTLSPLPIDNDARSQNVNTSLVCAKQIDLYPLSINGVQPPQDAFDYYVEKLKKYTTDNIVIHKTMEMTLEKGTINDFIQRYGDRRMHHSSSAKNYGEAFVEFTKKTEASKNAIVMIYTPELFLSDDKKRRLRGLAFGQSSHPHIVAYNSININNAPVITDNQAWKIVLTHEVGHRLGVPANSDHNKAGHCTSRECIMYARPDWQAVVSVIFHGMPYDFCHKCKAELKEAKEQCIKQPLLSIVSNTKEEKQ